MGDEGVLERILNGDEEPKVLPLALLQRITNDFSEERKIGLGRFGEVYKGVLRNGIIVAVKRIHVNVNTIDIVSFRREINSLMRINHQNVVRLLGVCSYTCQTQIQEDWVEEINIVNTTRERLVCFEYVNNGSLDKHITDELRGLDWETRYNLITGICRGLCHLHDVKQIMHLDLKPANILLDNDMVPKITDFGLSGPNENTHDMVQRFGTGGYSAPEIMNSGITTPACDIYSLGSIIMELVTGSKSDPATSDVLRRWRHRWNKPLTLSQYQQVTRCIEIARRCRQIIPERRPYIREIISMLSESESMDGHTGQIGACFDEEILAIEPLELRLPYEFKEISCSIQLMNCTTNFVAFMIQLPSIRYSARPYKGIMPPVCKCYVMITVQARDIHEEDHADDFIVQSMKVSEGLTDEDITESMFHQEAGKVVDEVNLMVVYEPMKPQENCKIREDTNKPAEVVPKAEKRNIVESASRKGKLGSNEKTEGASMAKKKKIVESTSGKGKLGRGEKTGMERPDDELEKKLLDSNATPMSFPIEFFKAITCDFSTESILGEGGFGAVYKGVLPSGKVVAVKKLFEIRLKEKAFQNEVCYLMGIKHPNVVQLLGYCAQSSWEAMELPIGSGKYILAEKPKRLLCFEYVCNKSLDKHISDESSDLEWNMRYEVIKGICNGLHFLHEECRMVHLDLKPQNILMDSTMMPKIADFGLSRIFGEQQSRIVTKSQEGTFGYMAPEYIKRGVISNKADIFGLGVIIVEIITGGRNYPYFQEDSPYRMDTSFQQFTDKVLGNWKNKFVSTPKNKSVEKYTQQVKQCVAIALKCVDPDMEKRPTTKDIIEELNAVDQLW